MGVYPPKEKLSLAAGLRCNDDALAAGEQPVDDLKSSYGCRIGDESPADLLLPDYEFERRGNEGQ